MSKLKIMVTKFKIAKYNKTESGFEHIGYDEYGVTYLKGTKPHQLRVVINGRLTKQKINLVDFSKGYKKILLSAISEYINDNLETKNDNVVTKFLTLSYIKNFYSKVIVKNVENYLINLHKEESRDILTKFNLV